MSFHNIVIIVIIFILNLSHHFFILFFFFLSASLLFLLPYHAHSCQHTLLKKFHPLAFPKSSRFSLIPISAISPFTAVHLSFSPIYNLQSPGSHIFKTTNQIHRTDSSKITSTSHIPKTRCTFRITSYFSYVSSGY